MRIAVDTNRYRDFCASEPEAVELFASARAILLPFVVAAVLRAGFLCGRLSRKNEAILLRFLSRPRVHVLFADEQTTHHYALESIQVPASGLYR